MVGAKGVEGAVELSRAGLGRANPRRSSTVPCSSTPPRQQPASIGGGLQQRGANLRPRALPPPAATRLTPRRPSLAGSAAGSDGERAPLVRRRPGALQPPAGAAGDALPGARLQPARRGSAPGLRPLDVHPASAEQADPAGGAPPSPTTLSPTMGGRQLRGRARTKALTEMVAGLNDDDRLNQTSQIMRTRHAEFWEMRDLVMSFPDAVEPEARDEEAVNTDEEEEVDDDTLPCPLADELIDIMRRAHNAYFFQRLENESEEHSKNPLEHHNSVDMVAKKRGEKKAAAQNEYGNRYTMYQSRKDDEGKDTTDGSEWKIEQGKFWPQPEGINTIDGTFGWNIAMHCAALGKERTLKRLIKFHYRKDGGSGSGENGNGDNATGMENEIETGVPLHLGHKSSRRLDLREDISIRHDEIEGEVHEGGYRHLVKDLPEAKLREFFDIAKVAGDLSSERLPDHRFGYWSIRPKKKGSKLQPVGYHGYHGRGYPRLSTVLSICHEVGEKDMKSTVQVAMKRSLDARRQGDSLASLTDRGGAMDFTDEASGKYKEVMLRENMFADAAVAMIMLYLEPLPGLPLPKSTVVEYKTLPEGMDPDNDQLQPWLSTTMEKLPELVAPTKSQSGAVISAEIKSSSLIRMTDPRDQKEKTLPCKPMSNYHHNTT